MSEELSIVGKPVPRNKAHEKATGEGKFTVDLKLPGMLTGRLLTSPVPHANIKRIDKSKAEALPGVEAVITFEDVPKKKFNPNKMNLVIRDASDELADMYILNEKARFVGDRIAAVAAINAGLAEEALELIEVEYEELPAVYDSLEAIKPGYPRIHDFAENNIARTIVHMDNEGDVEKGFEEADIVIDEMFSTSKQHLCQFEPSNCVANFDSSGRLTIWSMSQHPFLHRRKLAEMFDIPIGKVRWISLHIGGAWGKHGSLVVEPVCVLLAQKTGKPVKMEYSREEDFYTTETREAHIMNAKIGVKKDGILTALENNIIIHGGAYFTHNATTLKPLMGEFTGLYRCPNVYAKADAVYTNIPVSGGCRGYGNPSAMWALEQLMDMAAEKLSIDPLELRYRNLKKAGDMSNSGYVMETCTLDECMRLGAERIGWDEKKKRKKEGEKRPGIGMALMMHVTGSPGSTQHRNVYLKFNEDGTVSLMTGSLDIGQNLHGTISQIAAEVLGIHYEDIIIHTGDTDTTMFDQGMHACGGLYQVGNAVVNGAGALKEKLLTRAAKMIEADPEDLDIKDRMIFVKGSPAKGISVSDVTKEAIYNFEQDHDSLGAKGAFSPDTVPPPFGATFADVSVDIETGEVEVEKMVYVCDMGRAINPQTVEGQMEGGLAQGIGYVLTEDYFVNPQSGVMEADNFTTYKIPAAIDMPDMDVILYEGKCSSGPFGAKGVGECSTVGVAPAIANAIYDAIGVRITSMPITPEKIIEGLKQKAVG